MANQHLYKHYCVNGFALVEVSSKILPLEMGIEITQAIPLLITFSADPKKLPS